MRVWGGTSSPHSLGGALQKQYVNGVSGSCGHVDQVIQQLGAATAVELPADVSSKMDGGELKQVNAAEPQLPNKWAYQVPASCLAPCARLAVWSLR